MPSGKKRLLVSLGDPNGIGPEILLKIFSNKTLTNKYSLTIAGSKAILDEYSCILKLPRIDQSKIIEVPLPSGFTVSPGKTDKKAGKISGDFIRTAVKLCVKKSFDALVTMPVSKEALNLGGYKFPGHTEMLSKLTSSANAVMILYSKKFSTALITGHIPVKNVSSEIKKENIIKKIITVNNSLTKNFKINRPRISILSLNPHAGDGGTIGKEELNEIIPVISLMNEAGFRIRGPFSPDAYFANKLYGKFDITIAMYHDQGLIPFKMISFGKGVNFTAGLNIIRTSPDHGTAFDIAGTGIAETGSSAEAIALAAKLSGQQ